MTENRISIELDDCAKMPSKAHMDDAGFDLYAPYNFTVPAHGCAIVGTGVHIALPAGTYGNIKSKSGLNMRYDITADEGVVDAGYTGDIVVKLRNHSAFDYDFVAGDKIAQLVITQLVVPEVIMTTNRLQETERGDNGFGSSGR